jgi:nucleotide-binding universal stress UspA family protein
MAGDGQERQVIVAGVDGSPESVAALRWAGRYSGSTGAALRAVLAWHFPSAVGPAPVGVAPEPVRDEVEGRMRDDLAAAIESARLGPAASQVEARVSYGHPAQMLIDESKDADLLVVGHRGRGAFTSMLVGSVSMHCVTHAHCPVVVVRGADEE